MRSIRLHHVLIASAVLLAGGGLLSHPAALAHPDESGPHDHDATPGGPAAAPAVPAVEDPSRFHTDRPDPRAFKVPAEEDAFTFIVFGDRTGGPDDGIFVLTEAVRDANLIEPDLVMTVGDLVQGYNEKPLWQKQADEYTRVMNGLECPWYPVAGNHDVYWRDKDNSGDTKPAGEHEAEYEAHFGPLWYAIEHKNAWFIALYSDEGNPDTGEKTFQKPESQRMSPEQFEWLDGILEQARNADHVFLFLHHPRWRGRNYGDDWERIHERLAEAGNVSAVFAGHIHNMTYDGPKDGIEYVTLATVGGHQPGTVPRAGYLHHYNIVTVRKDRISMAAIPVGAAIDPRGLTNDVVAAAQQLARVRSTVETPVPLTSQGSADAMMKATVANPTSFPVDATLTLQSRDSNWFFSPDHHHGRIEPGESLTVTFGVRRVAGPADETFEVPSVSADLELLTTTSRLPIPTTRSPIPADVAALRNSSAPDLALRVDGSEQDHVRVPSSAISLPDGPMTLEAWMKADRFADRVGLATKAQVSDYGLFVNNGRPEFTVFLDDRYVNARGEAGSLKPGQWHHVAGVYDEQEVRLYIDGRLVARKAGSGKRKTNDLALLVGADVDRGGQATSPFTGLIDDLRLSKTARYTGEIFEPETRPTADENDLLLLTFDEQVGPVLFDDSANALQLQASGAARLTAE